MIADEVASIVTMVFAIAVVVPKDDGVVVPLTALANLENAADVIC